MNIVFIGMSGSGKTTIGKEISKILNKKFYDTDELIAIETEMPINSFFKKYGEEKFRCLERKIVSQVSKKNNVIISTGGGVILNKFNMINLKKNGIVIYLEANQKTLVKNLKNSNVIRPLIEKNNQIIDNIKDLYNLRENLYKKYSDIIINTDLKTIDKIVDIIVKNKKLSLRM